MTACNSKSDDKTIEKISSDSAKINSNEQQQDEQDIRFDTLKINNQLYVQTLKDSKFNCLLSILGDTIVKAADYYFEAQFLDIDLDNYKDIRVFGFSNTPNECENYLFDKTTHTFNLIENCDLDIHKIKGTAFFFFI